MLYAGSEKGKKVSHIFLMAPHYQVDITSISGAQFLYLFLDVTLRRIQRQIGSTLFGNVQLRKKYPFRFLIIINRTEYNKIKYNNNYDQV